MVRLALALGGIACGGNTFAQSFSTVAPHAMAMDVDTQTILLEKAADDPVQPASVAKLMTAELVFRDLKKGSITFDTPFYISEQAWKTGAGGASMFARVDTNDQGRGSAARADRAVGQ